MNKLIKKGFSLAEVLIALAIISVIASLGFSVAKKNIHDAYQGYFYSSFNGLYTALKIAHEDIYTNPISRQIELYSAYTKGQTFMTHFQNVLNLTLLKNDNGAKIYLAPNGVQYEIYNATYTTTPPTFYIDIIIPHVKTDLVNKNSRIVELKYSNGQLSSRASNYTKTKLQNGYVDIGNRKDLVAFECIEEISKIVHDCDDGTGYNDHQDCSIEPDPGKKTYHTLNTINPEECESVKVVDPRYAIMD